MKLYIVVGRISGMVGFVTDGSAQPFAAEPPSLYTEKADGSWLIKAFENVADATDMHESMIHSKAKLCRVVEIEIPDDDA